MFPRTTRDSSVRRMAVYNPQFPTWAAYRQCSSVCLAVTLQCLCHCHAVTRARHRLGTWLAPPCSDCSRRAEMKTHVLALFLSPPATLPVFFSLPCPQARLTKTSSGISTFQNTLQENKLNKVKKNNAKRQQQAVGLTWTRRLWGCVLGRNPNALSWQYATAARPHLPGISSSSANVGRVSDHLPVFTFSKTHSLSSISYDLYLCIFQIYLQYFVAFMKTNN